MARILAVDDSDQNRVLIELYLKGGEFEVVSAKDGREALDLASRGEFDLILLDVVMPGIDGFEVCRRLKVDPRTAFVPVIFLTAQMRDESDRLQAYEIGAVDYIQKPVHKDELVSRIRVMLRVQQTRNRLERENADLGARLGSAVRVLGEYERELDDLATMRRESRRGPTGLLLVDSTSRVVGHDVGVGRLFPELAVGRTVAEVGGAAQALARVLAGEPGSGELEITRDGAAVRVEVRSRVMEPGDCRAVLLTDVTEARRIERRMAERKRAQLGPRRDAKALSSADREGVQYSISGLIGRAPTLREVSRMVDRLRQGRSTVLVYGESGTGKELVARGLHFDGPHGRRPFIPIHCGAISKDLIESELFGYEKGAFTGAQVRREGLFSVADGGTIFLDEIAETSMDLQVKLLRVLQRGEIRPVGADHPRIVDVRILAATNRDLPELVRRGKFREDLFYRLEVVTLQLPPLRERVEDIPLLVEHFLQKLNRRYNRERDPVQGISRGALTRLCAYAWPGNVRELENAVDRAFALGVGAVIHEEDLPPHVRHRRSPLASTEGPVVPVEVEELPPLMDLRSRRDSIERRAIQQALEACSGDKQRAAQRLGMSRSTFYRRLKELEG